MSGSSFIGKCWVTGVTAVAAAALNTAMAQTPQDKLPEKIQFSTPSSPIIVSNLNQLNSDQQAGQFKGQVRPYVPEEPPKNPNGTPFTPVQIPQQSATQRARNIAERKRNWAFDEWNNLYADPTMQPDAPGMSELGPDEKDNDFFSGTKPPTTIDQRQPLNPTRLMEGAAAMESGDGMITKPNEFNPMSVAIPEGDKFLRSLFVGGGTADKIAPADHPLEVAPGNYNAQAQMEQIKRLMPGGSSPRLDATSILGDPMRAAPHNNNNPAMLTDQSGTAAPYRSILNQSFTASDPTTNAFHPAILDDPTARSLGMPNPSPPPVEQPKPPPPQDPFVSNMPKRKF